MGLATVIDLRTHDEAEQRGRFPVEEMAVRYLRLPLTDVLPATSELPSWGEASYVASRYLAMVTKKGPAMAQAVTALAANGGLPAVMHCSAGKDRTGVLTALLLAFLGGPDETIIDDYARSAPAMVRLLQRLKADYPDSEDAVTRFAPAVLHVVPETMEMLLASLRSTYGSDAG
jgi:protein-tyrosine phosphatase